MQKNKSNLVRLIIGPKVYQTTRKMAFAPISMAREKFTKENKNVIIALEKDDMIVLRKDFFASKEKLLDEVSNWKKGGYKCHYVLSK